MNEGFSTKLRMKEQISNKAKTCNLRFIGLALANSSSILKNSPQNNKIKPIAAVGHKESRFVGDRKVSGICVCPDM